MSELTKWIVLMGTSRDDLHVWGCLGASVRFKINEIKKYAEADRKLCVIKFKKESSDEWQTYRVFDFRPEQPVPYLPLKNLVKYYVQKDPLTDMPEDLYVQFGEELYPEQVRYCEDNHGNLGLKKILHGYAGPNGEYESRLVFVVNKDENNKGVKE